eukprot:305369_1
MNDSPYEMWVVRGCGDNDANGIYFEGSNPSHGNTVGFIYKSDAERTFCKISNDGNEITKETALTTYADILRQESRYYTPFPNKQTKDEIDIDSLTKEECKCLREHHGIYGDEEEQKQNEKLHIAQFIKKHHITPQNISWIRQYLKQLKSYKIILYKKDQKTNSWECINGKQPPPKTVEKISNEDIPFFGQKQKLSKDVGDRL